jgi:hypothetical protein
MGSDGRYLPLAPLAERELLPQVANGVLGTCSTDETLGFNPLILLIIVGLSVILGFVGFYFISRTTMCNRHYGAVTPRQSGTVHVEGKPKP